MEPDRSGRRVGVGQAILTGDDSVTVERPSPRRVHRVDREGMD